MRMLAIILLFALILIVEGINMKKGKTTAGHNKPNPFSEKKIAEYEKTIPGLKKDVELFGKCKKKVLKTTELRAKAALACKDQTDYTCYWACRLRERGFSGPGGLENYKKYLKGKVTWVTEKDDYVNTLAFCVQGADLETKECNDKTRETNSIALNCMISVHSNYCSDRTVHYKLSQKLDMDEQSDEDDRNDNVSDSVVELGDEEDD